MGFYSSLFIVYSLSIIHSLFIIHNLFIVYYKVHILVMNIQVCCVAEILLLNNNQSIDPLWLHSLNNKSICYFSPLMLVTRYVFTFMYFSPQREKPPSGWQLSRFASYEGNTCIWGYVLHVYYTGVGHDTFYMWFIRVLHGVRFTRGLFMLFIAYVSQVINTSVRHDMSFELRVSITLSTSSNFYIRVLYEVRFTCAFYTHVIYVLHRYVYIYIYNFRAIDIARIKYALISWSTCMLFQLRVYCTFFVASEKAELALTCSAPNIPIVRQEEQTWLIVYIYILKYS